ncbi:MAG: HTTM domain-containing protein [Acidimicrobiales bacterium]
MRSVTRWLLRPGTPRALAVVRIATNGWTLWYLARRWKLITRVARGDDRDFQGVGVVRPLKRPLPPNVIKATTAANYAATALATLGVAHRVSGPATAALSWWTLTYRNSWRMVYHSDNLAVLHLTVLGVSPAADALSVDALIAKRRGTPIPNAPSWQYGWPIQTINAVTSAAYFLAGTAKLTGSLGPTWATGEHLRTQIAVDGIRKAMLRPDHDAKARPFVEFVDKRPWMWSAFAVGSLVAELGAPIALVDRRVGRLWSLGAFGMHLGIKAIMQITFRYQLAGVPYAGFCAAPAATGPTTVVGATAPR